MRDLRKTILELIVVLCLCGCNTQKCIPTVEYRDSIRVEYKLDSIYIYEKDSIYVDRYVKGDTVYVNKYVDRIRYKDKIKEKTDTIYVNNEVVQTVTEKYIPGIYKWGLGIAIVGIIVLLIILVVKILKWTKVIP